MLCDFLLVVQKNLEDGEVLAVDVSCIAAVTATVNVQIKYNSPIRRVVFGVSLIVKLFYMIKTLIICTLPTVTVKLIISELQYSSFCIFFRES